MSTLREHIERAERSVKPIPSIAAELNRIVRGAAAERESLIERALNLLESDFGISRDRVNERGELEVSPEEFARLQSISAKIADYGYSSLVTDFEIKVIVVKSEEAA